MSAKTKLFEAAIISMAADFSCACPQRRRLTAQSDGILRISVSFLHTVKKPTQGIPRPQDAMVDRITVAAAFQEPVEDRATFASLVSIVSW